MNGRMYRLGARRVDLDNVTPSIFPSNDRHDGRV